METILKAIFKEAGLPVLTPRGMRHLFAAGFSDYVSDMIRDINQLRVLQERAAELMGTSRSRFKVRWWVWGWIIGWVALGWVASRARAQGWDAITTWKMVGAA